MLEVEYLPDAVPSEGFVAQGPELVDGDLEDVEGLREVLGHKIKLFNGN